MCVLGLPRKLYPDLAKAAWKFYTMQGLSQLLTTKALARCQHNWLGAHGGRGWRPALCWDPSPASPWP